MSGSRLLQPDEIVDLASFMNYCHQRLGVQIYKKDFAATGAVLKDFFDRYPNADYRSLARLVDWALAKRRRPATAAVLVGWYRYAWQDGYLDECTERRVEHTLIEEHIEEALSIEEDPNWVHRLINAKGKYREEAFEEWLRMRSTS